ncbi:MAG: S41 family peptidase [Deferrisomatales bacterium]|nr:S41 family peptidase [Deferrisomatales bacterium]
MKTCMRVIGPLLALLLMVCPLAWGTPPELDPGERDELYRRLKVLAEALDIVQRNYVEEVGSEDLVHGAVRGIIDQLDPHSSFLPADMFHEMQVETEGAFGGLGIEVSAREGRLLVVAPIEDTPASRAGIQAGDVIVMIEGEPVKDLPLAEAVKRMRGPTGTQVTIHVARKGWENPREFTLIREIIHIRSVRSRVVDGVGVVRIAQFQKETHVEVRRAVQELLDGDPLRGLVLDLRNNPGGLLDQAVKVADVFLAEGTVVSTRGRDPEQEAVFAARDDGDEPDLPLVVLINEGTASASEIVAGALQDHGRALVLGQRSFGKGSVQTILPLSDGSGLRVTTALYYTPADRSIQAKGIVPDIEVGAVAEPVLAPPKAHHGQQREEDLDGHFETPEAGHAVAAAETAANLAEDTQLQRAVQILKSWQLFRGTQPAPARDARVERPVDP